MSWVEVHRGFANSATLFVAVLALWSLALRLRSQPLNSAWFGAAVVGELLLLAQFAVGWLLWFQGLDSLLPRAWIHVLYGVVAVVTLPAAYSYFSKIADVRVQTLAMALTCFFLWGILLRASQVVSLPNF